ncbi:MAG: NRDE family protein [Steroidobacteraceae bacterium]
MCLLMLAWQVHPRYRLVVAANRDEYHERPAAALAKWADAPLIAGRDLRAHGTWLGLDRQRRFAVVTNFRELQRPRAAAPSRGGLIPQYLSGAAGPSAFLRQLEPQADSYAGFNLLLADGATLAYGSNRATPFARPLPPGVYGLSNELLDTPWPKLLRVRAGFEEWLRATRATAAGLFTLLNDRRQAGGDADAAHTGGLPPEWRQVLSAPFVLHPVYGTRCSTVVLLEPGGAVYIAERRFDAAGEAAGETEFRLNATEWP